MSLSRTKVYLLGSFVAIAVAVLSSLLSPGTPSTATLTLAIFAPLALILIVDRLSSQHESKEDLEAILQTIRTESVNSSSIIALGTDDQWIDYLIHNAKRARRILNTRLSYMTVHATAHPRIDSAIAQAVQSGTDYHFVCSKSREDSLSELKGLLEQAKADAGMKGGGKVVAYVFDTGNKPILQMKIFEYEDYSEAMIGFVFQTDRDVAQPILLIRDQKMVEYFRHVFYTYCENSKRVFQL